MHSGYSAHDPEKVINYKSDSISLIKFHHTDEIFTLTHVCMVKAKNQIQCFIICRNLEAKLWNVYGFIVF